MTPYKTGAPLYLQAGWAGVIPLPPRKKSAPPTGYTGWNGKDPSSKMIETWCNETVGDFQAASNIAIHTPDGIVGIDVDHYDGKTGGATLAQLENELGSLPPTYISTSRNDGVSGIRWYRVEPGLRWPTGPGKDIEFIHKGHRYAVVWPSVHPSGSQYIWIDQHSDAESPPPNDDELAWMPDEWQIRFTNGEVRTDMPEYRRATDDELAQCLTDGAMCIAVTKALNKFEDRLTVQARHDSALKTVMALCRLGEQGHHGVNSAIAELKNRFVNLVSKDRADDTEGPEYQRMVDGGVVKVLADPTPEENKRCCGSADYQEVSEPGGRWVNLDQYLDGTYTPPQPSIGAAREDGIQFLYPAMWHTNIALTTAGKTTFALWQVKAVLDWGGHVVYIHFEEANPNGIIHRLKGLGVNTEVIRKRFHWGHVDTKWRWGELAAEIEHLEVPPHLAILDGINAACGMHDWQVKEPESVGLYRAMFVHPLTKIGAAVLSLGHPPKAVNRQSESYSYGAAGWLNDVDGVGYRMTASKTPISKGARGSSALYVVKDRYGGVQQSGELQSDKEMAWWYMGQFVVDDSAGDDLIGSPQTVIQMTVPATNTEGQPKDALDTLGQHVIDYLKSTTGRFESVRKLGDKLRAKGGYKFTQNDLAPALERLANSGLIEWPEVTSGSRPGWLTDMPMSFEEPDV